MSDQLAFYNPTLENVESLKITIKDNVDTLDEMYRTLFTLRTRLNNLSALDIVKISTLEHDIDRFTYELAQICKIQKNIISRKIGLVLVLDWKTIKKKLQLLISFQI